MNVHKPIMPMAVSAALDGLDELSALLEAIHMMAADLEENQTRALQRVVALGQCLIENIQEGLRPGSSA